MSDPRITVLFTAEELRRLGRCEGCGWHPETQGHHLDCPREGERGE